MIGDRICPANPLISRSFPISASLRGSSNSLSSAARRRHSRSSSLVAARRESSLKRFPSASVPLLALGESYLYHFSRLTIILLNICLFQPLSMQFRSTLVLSPPAHPNLPTFHLANLCNPPLTTRQLSVQLPPRRCRSFVLSSQPVLRVEVVDVWSMTKK